MKLQTTIIALVFGVLLTGCGVNRQDHQRVLNELEETKQTLDQSQSEVSTFKTKLVSAEKESTRLKSELSSASSRVNELIAEVDRLKNQDSYEFAEAGRLADSGDLKGALRAYTAFIRDFPSSALIDNATSQVSVIEQRLEAHRREAAARAERERKENEQRELAAKLRQGMLTVPQLIPYLRGKTRDQVSDLLGSPNTVGSGGNTLGFYNKAYSSIKRSNDTILKVNFSGGIVYSVRLVGEQEYSAR